MRGFLLPDAPIVLAASPRFLAKSIPLQIEYFQEWDSSFQDMNLKMVVKKITHLAIELYINNVVERLLDGLPIPQHTPMQVTVQGKRKFVGKPFVQCRGSSSIGSGPMAGHKNWVNESW